MTINWFGTRVSLEMPVWAFAFGSAVFLVSVCAAAGAILARKDYVCRVCGFSFRARWYRIILAPQHDGDRLLFCPRCGCKSWCDRQKRRG